MSEETLDHLNTSTLIGNTDARGTAWHYRAELQGEEPNHYPGPIPVADVQRRLFDWHAESRLVAVQVPERTTGGEVWTVIAGRQAICRSDTHAVMGIFSAGYARHQYDEWLLTTVANLLDDNLSVSSAGLLKGGAVAWVEVSVPESITTPEGVVFRPNLLATTSFDGSIATTYKRTITDVVCDNTRAAALSETGQSYRVKHSRYSRAQLAPAREALAMIHTLADDFAKEIAQLCATPVTENNWVHFLDTYVPRVHRDGRQLTGRALTHVENKRRDLDQLYHHDERVTPWSGTAHGVLQAVNTYEHHVRPVRGSTRAARNMLRTVTGDFVELDRRALRVLETAMR